MLSSSAPLSSSMRSRWLPLLQQEQVVQCLRCKRAVMAECFDAHEATCRGLNMDEAVAQAAAFHRALPLNATYDDLAA